jgi:ADP-ribosylglycohydrolase
MVDLKDRFRGCVTGLAIGDSLDDVANGAAIIPGKYGDDTQMAICVVEALTEAGRDLNPYMEALSRNLVKWYKSQDDPAERRSPSKACIVACAELERGTSWEESGEASTERGSAARAAPIGLYFSDPARIVEFGMESSRVTHSSMAAMCASVGSAFMPYLAVKEVPVGLWASEIALVTSKISAEFDDKLALAVDAFASGLEARKALSGACLGDGSDGHEAMASALFCCLHCPGDFSGAVLMANTNNESDGVAAIVGATMGAKLGIQAIPEEWVAKVEGGQKLLELADKLYEARDR